MFVSRSVSYTKDNMEEVVFETGEGFGNTDKWNGTNQSRDRY